VTVVDDFAHHPTAVEKTVAALRQRYPGRRLVVLFEPRSLTAGRRFFFAPYRQAFAGADRVLFAPIFHSGRLAADERLDFGALAGELTAAGVPSTLCAGSEDVLRRALAEASDGDVVATMSSGSFEGLPGRLLEALRDGAGSAEAAP
jgi:UDP-N-acetylmuramate: L-alanyl-gamma-D-glutamyl-meso-diaminopimelate ligase